MNSSIFIHSFSSPMLVGRNPRTRRLKRGISTNACGGTARNVLFLSGEAGLGKTTLVHEWWDDTGGNHTYTSNPHVRFPSATWRLGGRGIASVGGYITQLHSREEQARKKSISENSFTTRRRRGRGRCRLSATSPMRLWRRTVSAPGTTRIRIQSQRAEPATNISAIRQYHRQTCGNHSGGDISGRHPLGGRYFDELVVLLVTANHESTHFIIASYRPDEAIAANDGEGHPIIKIKNEILRYGTGKETTLGIWESPQSGNLCISSFP